MPLMEPAGCRRLNRPRIVQRLLVRMVTMGVRHARVHVLVPTLARPHRRTHPHPRLHQQSERKSEFECQRGHAVEVSSFRLVQL